MEIETKPLRKTTAALIRIAHKQFMDEVSLLVDTVREEGEIDDSWKLDLDGMQWARPAAPEKQPEATTITDYPLKLVEDSVQ